MFDWICHNRDVFLMSYVEIGHSYQLAKDIQEEHNHFTMSSMVNFFEAFEYKFFSIKFYLYRMCM